VEDKDFEKNQERKKKIKSIYFRLKIGLDFFFKKQKFNQEYQI